MNYKQQYKIEQYPWYKIKKLANTIKTKYIQFILFFAGYLLLISLINKIHIILPSILTSFTKLYAVSFILINLLIIPTLVSLTLIISIEKIRDLRSIKASKGSVPIIAIFGTLLGGACPGCFVGLFPAFVGLFGSTLTLNDLPFGGLEIQIVSGAVLIISLSYLTRETVCKI